MLYRKTKRNANWATRKCLLSLKSPAAEIKIILLSTCIFHQYAFKKKYSPSRIWRSEHRFEPTKSRMNTYSDFYSDVSRTRHPDKTVLVHIH